MNVLKKSAVVVGVGLSLAVSVNLQAEEASAPQTAPERIQHDIDWKQLQSDYRALLKESRTQSKSAQTLGPAPGISQYRIYAVGSSGAGGFEGINEYQGVTQYDHSGTIQVEVLQIGYGNDSGANLGGAAPDYNDPIPLCGTTSLHECTAGETLVGWYRVYGFYNKQGGYFTSSAYSVAYPYGTYSDSISIK